MGVHQGSILYRKIITNGRGQLGYPDAVQSSGVECPSALPITSSQRCCDAPLFAFTLCRPHSPVILCTHNHSMELQRAEARCRYSQC
jgi:hypothetical protein